MTRKRWLELYDVLEEIDKETRWTSDSQSLIAFLKLLLIELKPEADFHYQQKQLEQQGL